MGWIRGDMLTDEQTRAVLNRFAHRMTYENAKARPGHVSFMRRGGYRLPLVSDAEWLADHCFYVTRRGELSERHVHCQPAYMHNVERMADHAR